MKILIVDDLPEIIKTVSYLVNNYYNSPEVDTASNGEEALIKTTGKNYDLIITDYQMPRMDGHQWVTEFRKNNKSRTPVVLLTGTTDIQDISIFDFILAKTSSVSEFYEIFHSVYFNGEEKEND